MHQINVDILFFLWYWHCVVVDNTELCSVDLVASHFVTFYTYGQSQVIHIWVPNLVLQETQKCLRPALIMT